MPKPLIHNWFHNFRNGRNRIPIKANGRRRNLSKEVSETEEKGEANVNINEIMFKINPRIRTASPKFEMFLSWHNYYLFLEEGNSSS